MIDEFPLASSIPMHPLTERGLNEVFLDLVERHRREELPVVVRREGKVVGVPVDQLLPELTNARNRVAELSAEIAQFDRSPFSLNGTP